MVSSLKRRVEHLENEKIDKLRRHTGKDFRKKTGYGGRYSKMEKYFDKENFNP